SLYVPTARETEAATVEDIGDVRDARRRRWKPWWHGESSKDELADIVAAAEANADNKEGGTGTRAKGEEGSMGNPNAKDTGHRYGVPGPQEAAQFGMIGLIPSPSPDPNAPVAAWGNAYGDNMKEANGAAPGTMARERAAAAAPAAAPPPAYRPAPAATAAASAAPLA